MKMSELIGSLAVDVAKVAASTAVAAGFVGMIYGSAAVGASIALGPLAVAIVIGVGASLALDYLDNRYQLKQRLSTMLADVADDVQRRVDQAREGIIDAGLRIVEAAIDLVVDEAGLTHLAYAPEIAGAMLRRQQAEAVIAARAKLVMGAVTMVEMALTKLSEDGIVDLDQERKATMVSNLMVVLCGEREAQPVVNAGTLYQ